MIVLRSWPLVPGWGGFLTWREDERRHELRDQNVHLDRFAYANGVRQRVNFKQDCFVFRHLFNGGGLHGSGSLAKHGVKPFSADDDFRANTSVVNAARGDQVAEFARRAREVGGGFKNRRHDGQSSADLIGPSGWQAVARFGCHNVAYSCTR
jgi:hypothetical protein